jgi:hypothetical protein
MSTMTSPIGNTQSDAAHKTPIMVRRELRQYASQLFKYTLKKLEETEGGHEILLNMDSKREHRSSIDSNRSTDDNVNEPTTLQNVDAAPVGI